MGIRVKAISTLGVERKVVGYYDHQKRYTGDVFELASENDVSDVWMVKVDANGDPIGDQGHAVKEKPVPGAALHKAALRVDPRVPTPGPVLHATAPAAKPEAKPGHDSKPGSRKED